ncbi:MAG: hypothetical protein OZ948_15500 [Deltaproteobacteria bacterium]|nr:hypothetical protein [Deltaproteobacteria bacterium]
MTSPPPDRDPHFDPDERLYYAVDPADIEGEGEDRSPNVSSIRFPDLSVNRGKYSSPPEVLVGPRKDWESWYFLVSEVPPTTTFVPKPRTTDTYSFKVEHDPIPDNYAHSEVRAYKNGERHKRGRPVEVRLHFRDHLRQQLKFACGPGNPDAGV